MKPQYESYYKQLGLNIAYYRKLRNLTQLDLAEFTDLSRTHISNIEAPNMKTSVSLDTLFRIAEILQIPAKELLDFRFEEKK
ncbi:MAG: helix-turn-helix transcriptional regulator [Eubacteriales bacterium]|nr:helix-turn-helix transcriptional regulator [Eubacteriales bacterium]